MNHGIRKYRMGMTNGNELIVEIEDLDIIKSEYEGQSSRIKWKNCKPAFYLIPRNAILYITAYEPTEEEELDRLERLDRQVTRAAAQLQRDIRAASVDK